MSSSKNGSSRGRAPARSGGGTLVGIFVGMMLGACIAAGAAWYFTRKSPFHDETPPPVRPRASLDKPVAIPAKPGDKPVEKPQFDFYKILPEGNGTAQTEVKPVPKPATPEVKPDAKTDPKTAKPETPKPETAKTESKPEAPTEKMFLQVGAFENADEAENVKARLAMMGIQASVQKVQTADKGTLSRVRVGPFSKPEEMGAVRSQLAQAGINAGVVRTPPPAH